LRQSPSRPGRTRRLGTLRRVALACVGVALLAGCQFPGSGPKGDPAPTGAKPAASAPTPKPTPTPDPPAQITVSPNGKGKALITDPVTVAATGGRLTTVKVTDAHGKAVAGRLDAKKTHWSTAADTDLTTATLYTVKAQAKNGDGKVTSVTKKFSTGAMTALTSTLAPLDNDTVGVGMPIVVQFSADVQDKKAIQKHMKVSAHPGVTGAWHWFNDREVHYRPKVYWPAGTDVKLSMDLRGVKASKSLVGITNRTRSFHIGRSQISKVDLNTHTLKYYVNGKLDRTIPITGGKPGFSTRSGIKVVLQIEHDITMKSETVGIKDPKNPNYYVQYVQWAIRVTWSGEFVHSAPWSVASQGNYNVSHGCVGMSTANASYLWHRTLRGDVVDVTGSDVPMERYGNGYGDWNYTWSQWKDGSAL
jgi:lipoprotein-anchoring transpeptidase ErfK/SrfK